MTAVNSTDDGAGPATPAPAGRVNPDADSALDLPAEDGFGVLSVVSGNPTDEELAALTAVVVALQATEEADEPTLRGRSWFRRAMLRLAPTPGPGSWRRSNR